MYAQNTSLDTSVDFNSVAPAKSDASGSAEFVFNKKNKSMKYLIVLCCGLQNGDGTDLINIDEDPWKSPPVATTKPSASYYKEEVIRRYKVLNLVGVGLKEPPRPKAWKLDRLLEWLRKYPLRDVSDVQFLREEVANREIVAERVNAARAQHKDDHDK